MAVKILNQMTYLKSSTSDTNMRFPSWALDFRGLHSGHPRAVFFSAKLGIGRMEGWQGNVHCPLTYGLPVCATLLEQVLGTRNSSSLTQCPEFTCRAFAGVFPTSVPKLTPCRLNISPPQGWSGSGHQQECGGSLDLWSGMFTCAHL